MRQVKVKTRVIMLFMILFCVLSLWDFKVKAEDVLSPNILMDVCVNFNQPVKVSRKADIYISVKNRGKSFTGYLVAEFKTSAGEKCFYKKQVQVAENQKDNYEMIIPASYTSKQLIIMLTDKKRNILVSQEKKLKTETDISLQCVGSIGKKIDSKKLFLKNDLKVINIDMNYLPKETDGLEVFDTIVVDSSSFDILSKKRYQSIKEWNQKGGTVILNGTSLTMRQYLGYGKKKPILIKDDDGILIYKVFTNEEGLVVEWLAQDGIYEILDNGEETDEIIKCLKENLSDNKSNQLNQEKNESDSGLESLLHSLKRVTDKDLPDIWINGFIIGIYILVSSLAFYLLVMRLKKRVSYYIFNILSAVFFCVLILAVNYSDKWKTAYVNYVSICKYNLNDGTQTENTFFNVMLPSKETGVLSVSNDYNVEMLNSNETILKSLSGTGFNENTKIEIINNILDTRIKIENPLYMKSYYFHAACSKKSTGKIREDLNYNNNKYSGMIQNLLGINLQSVILVGNNRLVEVGNLNESDTYQIDSEKKQYYFDGDNLKILFDRMTGKGQDSEKVNTIVAAAYNYCLKNENIFNSTDTFLIGIADKKKIDSMTNSGIHSINCSIIVYPIAIEKKE